MLVGESGLGKSTFTRALFRPYVPDAELSAGDTDSRDPIRARTTAIREVVYTVENDGFPIEFSVVDCPGASPSGRTPCALLALPSRGLGAQPRPPHRYGSAFRLR